jgi:hypothetical protein
MIGAECSAIAGRFAPTPPGSDVSAELQHDGSSRSSSSITSVTKPCSTPFKSFLQQPALMLAVKRFADVRPFWLRPGAVHGDAESRRRDFQGDG